MDRHSRSRGFTLIEMLMTLVVVAIVLTFVRGKIDLAKFSVDAAMQNVGTLLQTSQRLAVTRQHNIIVAFDVANEAIRVVDDTNNNGVADAGEHVRKVPLNDLIVFGLGGATPMSGVSGPISYVKTFAGLPCVTFHRDGSASEAGGIYITSLRAARGTGYPGDTRLIQTARASARVSWYRASPPNWVRGF
jgi:prepilin-type N-terminal cleavage/methylation domain-containing protein